MPRKPKPTVEGPRRSDYAGIYPSGKSSWKYVLVVTDPLTGSRRQEVRGGFRTDLEAWQARCAREGERDGRIGSIGRDVTVEAWVALWIDSRVRARETFLHPATAENRVACNTLWKDLTDNAMGEAETLEVLGRKLTVPKAAHACASFTFFELCGAPLGPPDYLAIAKAYRTVFISGVPKLKTPQRNETKRFILMIDTFYDAGTRLVVLAEGAAETLFARGSHAFESQRTISRLKEMQSVSWWGVTPIET